MIETKGMKDRKKNRNEKRCLTFEFNAAEINEDG